jgi:toxin ParE1/3/4
LASTRILPIFAIRLECAHELGLPGLRSRSVGRFPYLIFYVEQPDHIDVWRILHARRDIAEWLGAD